MVLDKERINKEINFISENVKKLNKLSELNKLEFHTDFRNIDSSKYLLRSSIEAMINLCNYVIIINKWGIPEDCLNAFEIMIKNSRLDKMNIENYEKLILLKDKLSYGYYDIENSEVYDNLNNNISNIEKFMFNISDFK